tara:strand:- start:4591 stop:5514 length:924 start_codon:yes stop_codon:yes gene_type:complete
MASDWYLKTSSNWKLVNNAFVKVSGSWKEIQEGYIKVSGAWKQFYQAFVATAFVTQTSNTTIVVPSGANALHVQAAVGGGASGVSGAEYDKSGGESGGTGGGSGGYVSDQVYSVTEGEALTFTIGAGGTNSRLGSYPNYRGEDGTATTLSGTTTGAIFTLNGGGAGGSNGGSSPNGSTRNNTASSGGSATVNASVLTSGSFKESDGSTASIPSASTLTQGPVGSYNQSGSGVAGVTGQNCSGDNCNQAGSNGAASYAGNIAGGTGRFGSTGDAGTRGSGGGGGGAQPQSAGGAGGTGEIRYRFLRVQ